MVSPAIIKNVKSVVVPNTNGLKGIKAAAAAGIISGRWKSKLEVLSNMSDEEKERIRLFLKEVPIFVEPFEDGEHFDLMVRVYSNHGEAMVRIRQSHTNVVYRELNGEVLLDDEIANAFNIINDSCGEIASPRTEARQSLDTVQAAKDRKLLNLKDILDFANTCDLKDVAALLERQIDYNARVSQEGLCRDYGANIGSTYLKFYSNDVRNRAIAKAASGSDARMSGCELPVIINSGSGNQGITVSVPVLEYARELGVDQNKLYRALIVSNLTAIHEKTGIGTLSAYCGAVSAGCAPGCGIAYLMGGDYDALAHTLVNSLAIVSGIICDGAKPSCAAKIASSVQAGILGYDMYRSNQQFYQGEGIVNRCVESTIKNVGQLGREGMRETDKEIVKIMMELE